MFEPNRREGVGKTVLDFAKILFGGQIASGFFANFPPEIRLGSLVLLVILFGIGWWALPAKRGD